MRKTLTLDEDVAAQLERLRRVRKIGLTDLVNEALRRGLREMGAPSRKGKPFQTRAFHMGEPLVDLDNAAEALACLEGDDFK
jgi:hypothetical protein